MASGSGSVNESGTDPGKKHRLLWGSLCLTEKP